MFELVSGLTADDVWQQAVALFKEREFAEQPGRGGSTKEILHAALSISDPRQRWVSSRYPALNVAFALAEVVWIVRGRRDLRFLDHWNSKYGDFTGNTPLLHGAYGYRLRSSLGFDQLEQAYRALQATPNSRQIVLQIWEGARDLPMKDGTRRSDDIPCNTLSMLKIRQGSLEWTQVIRSNDMFLGVPHNVVQFTSLQEVMAGWLGVKVGSYNQISDSLHVYARDEEALDRSPLSALSANEDNIALPKKESDALFAELERRCERLIECEQSNDVLGIARWQSAPKGFQNILSILAAESARRQGWPEMVNRAVELCVNAAFNDLWARWTNRVSV